MILVNADLYTITFLFQLDAKTIQVHSLLGCAEI